MQIPTYAQWRAAAEASLKGAPFERLIAKTYDGLAVAPLYTAADAPPRGLLGRAQAGAWDARQEIAAGDLETANAWALETLMGGATSLEIVTGPHGTPLRSEADLAALTKDWALDLAPIALGLHDPAAARLLFDFAKGQGLIEAGFAFNLDPFAPAMAAGRAPDGLEQAVAFAAEVAQDFTAATALRLDARPVHEAGGSEAQELGVLAAALVAYLRAGLPAAQAGRLCLATLALGPDCLLEIAKLRAARLVLARLLEACGASVEARGIPIQAVTGMRALTRRDPWVNILRATAAGFAAAVGGADVITIAPMSAALGRPDALARRLARNTHAILLEEANLARVADPAAGAYAFEALTEELAAAGWGVFQAIEREGGLGPAIASGWLARETARVAAERLKNVRRRKDPITGVSEFPLLGERTIQVDAPPPLNPPPLAGEVARRAGGGTSEAPPSVGSADSSPANGGALIPLRLAEPFERLRDAAEAAGGPAVFLATLGTLSDFSARAQFASNLMASGGVAALGAEAVHADDAALVDAFRASGAKAACLCGSDAAYAERAEAAARALKAAGCAFLLYAGRPGEREAALQAAGVDLFVYAGMDAVEALDRLHAALGVSA